MSHGDGGHGEALFERLLTLDEELAAHQRAAGCARCGGRLDRADFPRKVRGVPRWAEPFFATRIGLCCAREGCRRRTLPASVRFLGRKVYAAVAIVAACVAEAAHRHWQEARRVARWLAWWREVFASSAGFAELRGRLAVPIEVGALPGSLLARLEGAESERTLSLLRLVAGLPPPATHEDGGGR